MPDACAPSSERQAHEAVDALEGGDLAGVGGCVVGEEVGDHGNDGLVAAEGVQLALELGVGELRT
jgi:hypothetical protein